jgi:hypothetical protein
MHVISNRNEIQFVDRPNANVFASVDDGVQLFVGINNGHL